MQYKKIDIFLYKLVYVLLFLFSFIYLGEAYAKGNDKMYLSYGYDKYLEYSFLLPASSDSSYAYRLYKHGVNKKNIIKKGLLSIDIAWLNGVIETHNNEKSILIVEILNKSNKITRVLTKEYKINLSTRINFDQYLNSIIGVIGVLIGFFITSYKENKARKYEKEVKNQELIQRIYIALSSLIDQWDLADRDGQLMSKFLKPKNIRKAYISLGNNSMNDSMVIRPKIIFQQWKRRQTKDEDLDELLKYQKKFLQKINDF